MRRPLSTRTLVLASASHPWRTIAAWAVAAVLAIVAIGALLGGSLSTENLPTDNRQSERASNLIDRSFPAGSRASGGEVIVVRSENQTVDSPQFRGVVGRLAGEVREVGGVASATTYVDGAGASLVSRDRHATLVPVNLADSDAIEDVIAAVESADDQPLTPAGQGRASRLWP